MKPIRKTGGTGEHCAHKRLVVGQDAVSRAVWGMQEQEARCQDCGVWVAISIKAIRETFKPDPNMTTVDIPFALQDPKEKE